MAPEFAQEIKQQFPEMNDKTCYLMGGPIGYHHFFVPTFFVMAIVMVWRFTAHTPANPTPERFRRNWIYRICAVVMAVAYVFIAFLGFSQGGHNIFWPETVAVVSFGVAWLVKGQTILKDPLPSE
jgi:4-amino-4-deoxy-L-arabinose transferase-like glycosyltransferase